MNNKFKLKSLNSGRFSKALAVGILASLLSCGTVSPTYAAMAWDERGYFFGENTNDGVVFKVDSNNNIIGIGIFTNGETDDFTKDMRLIKSSSDNAIVGLSVSGRTITYTKGNGTTGTITTQDTDTTYSAGNGIAIGSDNKVSVKPGTNVTVDGNGVSVNGNGLVGSGDTGLINGGTAYSELRPSANGNYVKLLKIQYNESFCHTKPPGLCPSLKKQAVLFFLRPVHERAV